jgi:hypothetical protein
MFAKIKGGFMSTKRIMYLTSVIIMLVLLWFPLKAAAQGLSGIGYNGWGVRAGLSGSPDQGYGGIHVDLGEFHKDVRFRPSLELGFGDDQTVLQMLAEVHYVFSKYITWKPYLGGGLGLTYINYDNHHGDDSDTGISLSPIGGIETKVNPGMNFFAEIKVGLGDDDPNIKFVVGITWK